MSNEQTDPTAKWPYPIDYEHENASECDVLIIGGGIAGCHAATGAAKRDAKVILVEKGATIRSGHGGAGTDHWHGAVKNPCSKFTPDQMMEEALHAFNDYFMFEWGNGITTYILLNESWDALQDVEKMGVAVRDIHDEFVGAAFRGEQTKLMFAYDYNSKDCIRINGGSGIKPALYKEVLQLGVTVIDRVMVTSLLTEEGKQGARVVGATGLNTRSGEFYIIKAKSTILSTAQPWGLWNLTKDLIGSGGLNEPNATGDGTAMAWRAGAKMTMMERSTSMVANTGSFAYPSYGVANTDDKWHGCSLVDANGKVVPWVDRDGKVLKTEAERFLPVPGQSRFFLTYASSTATWDRQSIPNCPNGS